jgi:hypothetical protein
LLDDLCIVGNQANAYMAIIANGATAQILCGSDVAIYNFDYGVQARSGGYVSATRVSAGLCGNAFYALDGGVLSGYGMIANGSITSGLIAYRAWVYADAFRALGGGSHGIVASLGGAIHAQGAVSLANNGTGVISERNSAILQSYGVTSWNEGNGAYLSYGGCLVFNNSWAQSNQVTGISLTAQSKLHAGSATIQSNGNGGLYLDHNSYANRSGATISGNTSFQTSPATIPSVGNYDAVIV